jgi:hypothetical protein
MAVVAAVGLTATAAGPVVAQEKDPDTDRVLEILYFAEARAMEEADAAFSEGDYPRVIQQQRIRYELRPWDDNLVSELIWMLGNVAYEGERVALALRFVDEHPELADRALPAAEMFMQRRLLLRIPSLLEADILRDPPPHRNAYTILSSAYRRMGYDPDVVRVLDVALKHFPGDPVFLRNREAAEMRIRGGKSD